MAELHDVTDQTFAQDVLASADPRAGGLLGRPLPRLPPDLAHPPAARDRVRGAPHDREVHAAENPSTSTKLGVRAMPTILAFAKGKVVGQLVGARPKAAFTELIERALKAA